MIITYYGVEFFKLQVGDFSVAFNPVAKKDGAKTARFGTNVALVSLNHPRFNGVDQLSYGEKAPFVISGPGEYEVGGLFIKGFQTNVLYGTKEEKINTVYYATLDGISFCFLGALDKPTLDEKTLEEIGKVDILFVPIGGKEVLSPAEAYKLSVSFEPGIILPMHYEKAALKKFAEEVGNDVKPIEKLTIKKKDVAEKEGELVVLKG